MAVVCGIHCLVTPVLLVALPILATTFWVDENFHLRMLLFVIPTTSLAVWSGCRRHKDKWVLAAAIVGIGILIVAVVSERAGHARTGGMSPDRMESLASAGVVSGARSSVALPPDGHASAGGCCSLHPAETGEPTVAKKASPARWHALLNAFGGMFLVAGQSRNFLLCRRDRCEH